MNTTVPSKTDPMMLDVVEFTDALVNLKKKKVVFASL